MLIYKATNKINGKEYIGQTVGRYGKTHSKETKEKMSEARKRYWANKKS